MPTSGTSFSVAVWSSDDLRDVGGVGSVLDWR